MSLRDIAKQIGCGHAGVDVMLRGQSREARPVEWVPRHRALSIEEREEILRGLSRGDSLSAIARQLGRHTSSVSREVSVNGGRDLYRIWPAHQRAREKAKRPKTGKLSYALLAKRVTEDLEKLWSPEEIALRLRLEFPEETRMQVSHETIYQSLYVQGRGELRRELARCLRYGHTTRQSQGRVKKAGPVANMVNISERPQEVEDRAVPGHWEGDLIIGLQRSAIGTVVERTTRFTLLVHLPREEGYGVIPRTKNGPALAGYGAISMKNALATAMSSLPEQFARSLTWDRGKEMSAHAQFKVETGIPVFFADPQSPWQRGTNENTNGLLRQYFPKGTDLARWSAEELEAVAHALNTRPRKTLDWKTPAEAFNDHLLLIQQAGVASTG
jgi:IS30 family transposase